VALPGVEPVTYRSRNQHANHSTTAPKESVQLVRKEMIRRTATTRLHKKLKQPPPLTTSSRCKTNLDSYGLFPRLQFAYRANHSTLTAVLKVQSDILLAIDDGNLSSLALLDLSAAFDTVDHDILLQRLNISYRLNGTALNWFGPYLIGWRQRVRIGSTFSAPSVMFCGVPQGSVFGPILFLLYTAELLELIESNGLRPHLYADDTLIYGFCAPNESQTLQICLSTCIDHVAEWMRCVHKH